MKSRVAYILAFIGLAVPLIITAQSTTQFVPKTPSEAYESATLPLREWARSENKTLETNVQAWKEQERRAKSYAPLFKLDNWTGEQLLSLAQLYLAADQTASAEKAYLLYLRDPKAPNTTVARKGLLNTLFVQEKWEEAIPVTNLLLAEPKYDQDIILWAHTLIDALRLTDSQHAIALSEKMLPALFRYAESKANTPDLTSHAAEMLVYGLEPAAIYRHRGDLLRQRHTLLLSCLD
jgi:hypothetical protein